MINENIKEQLKPGMTVRVWEKIQEGDKERTSRFEGIIIARKHGKEAGATFTVRGTVASVGVEKVYPLHSPMIDKVEILGSPKRVRRSKLYFIRNLSRKAIRKKLGASAE